MKKNLRNVLALALGLITTVSFAQDWNVDSRTRIDMSGDHSMNTADQRVTLGATWGGSDWGIHVSSDLNYTVGTDGGAADNMGLYEAYASTDLFGMANMTIGRQALSYGSGALMSGNDWGTNRTTWDGMTFDLGLSDLANITVGYHSSNQGGENEDDAGNMHTNISGSFSGWNVNVLYMTNTDTANAGAATGIDLSGELMGATVSASINTDFAGNEMTSYGLSYAVNDDMSVSVNSTTYGDDAGFRMAGTNMDGSWNATGGMGYLGANDEDLSYGLSYNMGGISLSATMHNITNATDETYERSVTEVGIGYSLGDNAGLGISYATDATEGGADNKYTWVTLSVTP
ncbi:hypothetical protein OAJ65_01895 [Flavobacteriales bacterium]|nr:hypothetical protein [Flavobacteriales bacterium]